MKALSCPRCGAPLRAQFPTCPYCGVGLVEDHSPDNRPDLNLPPPAPVQIPEGWIVRDDTWHGFSIAFPPGWRIFPYLERISVREDPIGLTEVMIKPVNLNKPANAFHLASQYTFPTPSASPTT